MDPDARRGRPEDLFALVGAPLVLAALALLWVLRARADGPVYVSELGADGEPTAAAFEVALLLIAAGGSAVAWSGRHLRCRTPGARLVRAVGLWSPAVTLWVACAAFLLASQVRCSAGCPVPGTPASTWADLVHTASAGVGFAAAAVAMLQTAFSDAPRPVVRLSLAASVALAVAAGTGGILSLLGVGTDVGGVMEYAATSVGLGWLAALGAGLAARPGRASASAGLDGGLGARGCVDGPTDLVPPPGRQEPMRGPPTDVLLVRSDAPPPRPGRATSRRWRARRTRWR